MSILQANTPFMVEAQRVGASGMMGIAVNVIPGLVAEIYRDLCEGKSAEHQHQLMCLTDSLLRLCYPVSGKIMLSMLGFAINESTRMNNNPVSNESRKLIETGFKYIKEQISSNISLLR